MKFLLILKQSGEGCDFTIGCGIRLETIEISATLIKEEYVKNHILENYSGKGDYALSEALLVPIEYIEHLPIFDWYGEQQHLEEKCLKEIETAKEIETLRKLKEKYPME